MSPAEPIDWSVELPEKKRAALGQKRPRARLIIGSDETILIPVAVGRKLQRLKKEHPSETRIGSRAELLYKVKELSKTCAHDRMENLINYRDYSSKELADRLREDGYHESVVQEIVSRAVEVGIVCDRRFAESFIRTKTYAGWGSAKILRELERRGITAEGTEDLLELMPEPEDEAERACAIARSRRLTGKNDYQKIVRHLVSRGFSVSAATSAARRVLEEARDEFEL